jgi:hypothetical protein
MRYLKIIIALFCLAGILLAGMAAGAAVSAQALVDPAEIISRFLPEGRTLLTATKAELAAAVEKAVNEEPGRFEGIVKAAAGARPDAVEDIVNAAIRIIPEETNAICFAVMEGAPERAIDVHACQDAFEAAVRLEGLPVTKPTREEPSPIRPR